MKNFENKVLTFMASLQNAYRDEEDREELPKLELKEKTFTEDFTAMLFALFLIYQNLTHDDTDFIGFTHVCNRLAVQHCMDDKEES